MSRLLVLLEGIIFVSSVYILKNSRDGHRNSSRVILTRIATTGLATILCTLISYFYYNNLFDSWFSTSFKSLEFCYIFLGQILLDIYLGRELIPKFSLITLRNLVFGPLFEEIVFRGNMIPLLHSKLEVYLLPSIVFGFSHIHHGIHGYITGDLSLMDSIYSSIFQFTYTFIFGIISTWYFLKTESIVCVIVLHSVCNYFGVPDFGISGRNERIIFWTGTFIGLYQYISLLK